MIRPLIFIATGTLLGLGVIRWAFLKFGLQKGEVINCLGFLFLLASAILLYFQVKSGLSFERRRITNDFMHGPIMTTLRPLERQIAGFLGRKTLVFEDGVTIAEIQGLPRFADIETAVLEMLNFYERMAIALRSGVFDEHMLYDDRGVLFIGFCAWAEPLINDLRNRYDPRAFVNMSALAAQWSVRYDEAVGKHKLIEVRTMEAKALRKRSPFS